VGYLCVSYCDTPFEHDVYTALYIGGGISAICVSSSQIKGQ